MLPVSVRHYLWYGVNAVKRFLFWLVLLGVCASVQAAETDALRQQKFISLDNRVQSIKQEAIDIGKEIAILEEQLLYPPETQFVLYLAADVDETFKLMQVMVKIGEKATVNYMYGAGELEALVNGGVHQLYKGNLTQGKHKLAVIYMGMIDKRMVRKELSYEITKGQGPAVIELQISGKKLTSSGGDRKEPAFGLKEWK